MSFKYYEQNYMSFCPKINNKNFFDYEPIWIMPKLKHNFNWGNKAKE